MKQKWKILNLILAQLRLVDLPIWTKGKAWEQRGPDLTWGRKISLAEAPLGSCLPGKSGEEVYASYFVPYTLIDTYANL